MAKRLFLGLELPMKSRLLLASLDPGIRGVRWVAADQLHLTLSFIGQVEPESEERLRENLAAVRVPCFFLPIQGVGTFGGNRPKVVWAGVGHGHPHLSALHKHLQDAVFQAGLEPDLKPFHPHITLGRIKEASRESLLPFLRRHAQEEFDLCKVTEFALFSSQLNPWGATHRVELRRELA